MAAAKTSSVSPSSVATPTQGKQVVVVSSSVEDTPAQQQQIHIIAQPKAEVEEAVRRREILARQPSYCKILNDLKEAESSGSEDSVEQKSIVMKGETVDIVDPTPSSQGQTVVINGQQYQIVSPSAMDNVISLSGGSQFSSSNGGTVFLPAATSPSGVNQPVNQAEEQARKREIRLMKNREAARECRNKKKEYIKCLENRVAVLENQNKALIEELKNLKELYKSQN